MNVGGIFDLAEGVVLPSAGGGHIADEFFGRTHNDGSKIANRVVKSTVLEYSGLVPLGHPVAATTQGARPL